MALPNSNLSQLLNHADKVVKVIWNYFWSIIFFISHTSQMWPSTNACARVLVCVFCVCVCDPYKYDIVEKGDDHGFQ